MPDSHEDIFKKIASRIVGQWHYHRKVGTYTFSLIPSMNESAKVFISSGFQEITGDYSIKFNDDTAILLSVSGIPTPFEAVIKVLTNDSLVLQSADRGIEIFERMPDVRFADEIIDQL